MRRFRDLGKRYLCEVVEKACYKMFCHSQGDGCLGGGVSLKEIVLVSIAPRYIRDRDFYDRQMYAAFKIFEPIDVDAKDGI